MKKAMAPTPVLLPGKSHGWRSLVGCSPWGRWGSDTTERLHFHFSLFTFMHWRRKWQPTPVFLPGDSQGWWSLVGCRLWDPTESDTTEATQQQQQRRTAHLAFHLLLQCLPVPMNWSIGRSMDPESRDWRHVDSSKSLPSMRARMPPGQHSWGAREESPRSVSWNLWLNVIPF